MERPRQAYVQQFAAGHRGGHRADQGQHQLQTVITAAIVALLVRPFFDLFTFCSRHYKNDVTPMLLATYKLFW